MRHIRTTRVRQEGEQRASTLVVALPPILVNSGEVFFSPVTPALVKYSDVMIVSYAANGFDPDATAHEIRAEIVRMMHTGDYKKVILLGISLGGTLTPMLKDLLVGAAIGESCITRDMIKVIICDSPSGVKSICGGLNRLLARAAPYFPKWRWFEWCFRVILTMLLEGPKPQNLEKWSAETDYAFVEHPKSEAERDRLVCEYVLANLRRALRSSVRQYIQQIAWLTWPWLYGDLRDVETIYVACTNAANTTVIQPLAADEWVDHTNCRVREMNVGAHVPPWEQPTAYRKIFSELLSSLVALVIRYGRLHYGVGCFLCYYFS